MELRKAVDNLCLYDPEFQAYAEKFVAETGGSSAIRAVGSRDDLTEAINAYTNVRFLEICLHGQPGMLIFADKGGMIGQNLGAMTQNTPFLQKNARVLFDSCRIGEGETGDLFMDELGRRMFRGKGGIIGASTVNNILLLPKSRFCTGIYMDPVSSGLLKVRRYDESGNRVAESAVDSGGRRR